MAGEEEACIVTAETTFSAKKKECATGNGPESMEAVATYNFAPLKCNGAVMNAKEQEI